MVCPITSTVMSSQSQAVGDIVRVYRGMYTLFFEEYVRRTCGTHTHRAMVANA